MTSALGFKVRVDFLTCTFSCLHAIPQFTSGATPADYIEVSMAAGHVPHMHVRSVGLSKAQATQNVYCCKKQKVKPKFSNENNAVFN